ncbi:putative Polyprotein [Cucumis melo var. makuwa]|uniref:Polyprotein n=1 Tax=Cucumis melo var. makuwa TaxID=1194695 RepID=A0A5A7VK14_CUCMM|nr:putative Polyprotein [Cucumis melo var. makuwa]
MKDLGEADVILGIKITRTENGISLDQSHYIEKILKKYNYFDSKPTCTPYDSSVKLFKNTGDSVNQFEYASIIGSLRYAADCIRPNIAYAIGLLCYNDADWNSFSDDSKAISDYIFNIARGAVALKSKKKTILAQSMMESEMIALCHAPKIDPQNFSKLRLLSIAQEEPTKSHTVQRP